MPSVEYTIAAERDLSEIILFTAGEWGARQADLYLTELTECFDMLARDPGLGRSARRYMLGLRRAEKGSHSIYYLPTPSGILVVRILHQRMRTMRKAFRDVT